MRRSLLIALALVCVGAGVFFAGQRLVNSLCAQRLAPPTDDLAWLRLEFHLNDAELARVRELHDGYLPKCHHFCALIYQGKQDLQHLLASPTDAAAIEKKLIEIGTLRAQCQSAMLQHFREVSQAMPPEQGRRYLDQMQRLTLGFHEQIEHSMSADASAHHGHH